MRLITWNVNKRRDITPQVDALCSRDPDVIALQEVTPANLVQFREAFAAHGLLYSADSDHVGSLLRRGYGLIVSRYPLVIDERIRVGLPFPQGFVSVRAQMPFGMCALHAIHVPSIGSYTPDVKLGFAESIVQRLAVESDIPRILCGDFNAPRAELADGTLITFGQTLRADGRYALTRGGEREDAAERGLLSGLAAYDLTDAYRRLHGYGLDEGSWVASNRGRAFPFRLDHILTSQSLIPESVQYLHAWREGGVSDHSAMEGTFSLSQD